ncbi:MAG TPA: D-cysteine desulfhydrase family protein [Thermotogota bacterium]|nr:D-cysteine desulfhydrase family protein [Thermotogota bacterium]HRW91853.1 D-cysteine desulfhydrase family protein [Thermotogota bacterium]
MPSNRNGALLQKIPLMLGPTPVDFWQAFSHQVGVEVWAKRDDLTHFLASGNKIRKLEYLFAQAVQQECTFVITCGGIQSNHCRATAVIARNLGMQPVLFLRGTPPSKKEVDGNLFLDTLCGAQIHWIDAEQYQRRDELMLQFADSLPPSEKAYIIPEGGSNALGALGYVAAAFELSQQVNLADFDALFLAIGSGGTLAGLAFGLALLRCNLPLFGINVTKTPHEQFTVRVEQILQQLPKHFPGAELPTRPGNFEILDDFVGEGYAIPTPAGLNLVRQLMRSQGALLDPVYTAKALDGALQLSQGNFSRILFLHSGGGFSNFAYKESILD